MISRLIEFYHRTCPDMKSTMHPVWCGVEKDHHTDLLCALEQSDARSLVKVLEHCCLYGVILGIDSPRTMRLDDWHTMKMLSELSYRCGVLPYPNPEQPSMTDGIFDTEKLVDAISGALGFSLSFPDVFGYSCSEGIGGFPSKFPQYCAAAYTINLLRGGNLEPASMLEIGGGMGIMPMIAKRIGVHSYTMIDLPSVAVISAYFMSTIMPVSLIWLEGEPENPSAWIRFYASTNFQGAYDQKYDIVLNMDSFPEIPKLQQSEYLKLIESQLSKNGFFLSINQETDVHDQNSVPSAMKSAVTSLSLRSRAPFMMRKGYMEEVYKL